MAKRRLREPEQIRQEEILDALEETFLKEGFRKVTIAELASKLRCSRRCFYELADSKEGLFIRVLERLLARIRNLGDEALTGLDDPGEQIEAFLRPGFTETLQASDAFFADIESLPRARRIMEKHQAARIDGFRRLIEKGVRRGQLRRVNPYLIGEASRVVARRLKEPDFLRDSSLSAAEAFREWMELLLHGVLHPTKQSKRRRPQRR